MIRLEINNCHVILTEKHKKYQLYHLEKLLNMKKYYCVPNKEKLQNKLSYLFFFRRRKTKTIENQGEKQVKAIEVNKKQLYINQPGNYELLISKEREIFKNIYNKRLNKIDELSKTNDYGDLKFIISSSGTETDFSELKDPVALLDNIEKREISIEEARHKQE